MEVKTRLEIVKAAQHLETSISKYLDIKEAPHHEKFDTRLSNLQKVLSKRILKFDELNDEERQELYALLIEWVLKLTEYVNSPDPLDSYSSEKYEALFEKIKRILALYSGPMEMVDQDSESKEKDPFEEEQALKRQIVNQQKIDYELRKAIDDKDKRVKILESSVKQKDEIIEKIKRDQMAFVPHIKSIEDAINECSLQTTKHRKSANSTLALTIGAVLALAGLTFGAISLQIFKEGMEDKILLTGGALEIVLFGVMMANYRFFLNEASKSEHYKVGFIRIGIAGRSQELTFQSEVRSALTSGAFEYFGKKEKKIENPLPGHPTTDLTAVVLNKILDGLEFSMKRPTQINGSKE